MQEIFGKKIKKILKVNNLTMRDFAEICDMPYKRVYDFCTFNVKNPTLDSLQKIIAGCPQYTSYILDIDIKSLPEQLKP